MTTPRLPMKTKLGFGLGAVAEFAIFIAFNTWNFLFYNQVLGLSGTLCGLAATLSLVIDAVSDPVVGSISDRVRGRLGRRHPFLYASAIPLGIFFVLIYIPPAGLSGLALFAWFAVTATLQRQALTLYQVPHLALGAELSSDYRERSVVMSYNSLFTVIGGTSTAVFGWAWFGKMGGVTSRAGYPGMAIGVATIAATSILLSAHLTRDRIPFLPQASSNTPPFSFKELFHEIRACFGNRNYTSLLLGLVFLSVALGTRETLNPYSSLYFWGLKEKSIGLLALASPPAFIVGFILTVRLHDRFDKRGTLLGAVTMVAIVSATPVLLKIAGFMPPSGSKPLFFVLALFVFLFYTAVSIMGITLLSTLADVADEHEMQTGRRQQGVFFASRTLFFKLTTGLGHVIAGVAVDVIGFPSGAKPGMVPESIVTKLALVEGPLGAVFAGLALIFYARYRIDRARHAEIARALTERRKASIPPPAQPEPLPSAVLPEPAPS